MANLKEIYFNQKLLLCEIQFKFKLMENRLHKSGRMIDMLRFETIIIQVRKNDRNHGQYNKIDEATNNTFDKNITHMFAFLIYSFQIFQ